MAAKLLQLLFSIQTFRGRRFLPENGFSPVASICGKRGCICGQWHLKSDPRFHSVHSSHRPPCIFREFWMQASKINLTPVGWVKSNPRRSAVSLYCNCGNPRTALHRAKGTESMILRARESSASEYVSWEPSSAATSPWLDEPRSKLSRATIRWPVPEESVAARKLRRVSWLSSGPVSEPYWTWNEAVNLRATRLASIPQQLGPDSCAGIGLESPGWCEWSENSVACFKNALQAPLKVWHRKPSDVVQSWLCARRTPLRPVFRY